jgi:RNA polymerase sigma factor (sigma-70 family)
MSENRLHHNLIYREEHKYIGSDEELWIRYWAAIEEAAGSQEKTRAVREKMEEILWKIYFSSVEEGVVERLKTARSELVIWYTSFRNAFARRVIIWTLIKFGLSSDLVDEMVQEIVPDLINGIENYSPDDKSGASPRTYLYNYIYFGVLNSSYFNHYHKSSDKKKFLEYQAFIHAYEANFGQTPTMEALSAFTGSKIQKLRHLRSAYEIVRAQSLEGLAERRSEDPEAEVEIRDASKLSVEKQLMQKEMLDALIEKINGLSPLERHIVEWFLFEGITLKEISSRLELSYGYIRRRKSEIYRELASDDDLRHYFERLY